MLASTYHLMQRRLPALNVSLFFLVVPFKYFIILTSLLQSVTFGLFTLVQSTAIIGCISGLARRETRNSLFNVLQNRLVTQFSFSRSERSDPLCSRDANEPRILSTVTYVLGTPEYRNTVLGLSLLKTPFYILTTLIKLTLEVNKTIVNISLRVTRSYE